MKSFDNKDCIKQKIAENISSLSENLEIRILLETLQQYDNADKNRSRLEEMTYLEAIYRGDVAYMRDNYDSIVPKFHSILNDEKRNAEYYAVFTISFAVRAGINAGIPFEKGMHCNNIYLKEIAMCNTVEAINAVVKRASIEYTALVHSAREEKNYRNDYIGKCKYYITSHICEKITPEKVAQAIDVSPAYLSKLFRKRTGITMVEYIQNQKIYIAKYILEHTNKKINDISDFLKFSKPAYFSTVFEKVIGMTPTQYRLEHHLSEQK